MVSEIFCVFNKILTNEVTKNNEKRINQAVDGGLKKLPRNHLAWKCFHSPRIAAAECTMCYDSAIYKGQEIHLILS